ncbi:MAG TPA: threonylcarbamoyl-AMP synthase [Phaeodactylibacter sp.]|nr:threonylcarbamoyl-AMP synthase [Phaeodactylibacter sp.]
MFGKDNLHTITSVLHDGGLILYPTDTIWGIGCDATNPKAVQQVFDLKQRPTDKPFVLLVDSVEMLKNYVKQVHPRISTLLMYHTHPLTIVYPEANNLPDISYANDGSVAIRVAMDSFCKELIGHFGKPIIASSANVSNAPFPTHFGAISSDIIVGVDYVVKWKQSEKKLNQPSSIAKLSDKEELIFLRE